MEMMRFVFADIFLVFKIYESKFMEIKYTFGIGFLKESGIL